MRLCLSMLTLHLHVQTYLLALHDFWLFFHIPFNYKILSDKLDFTSNQNWHTKMERIETKKLETRSKKIATIWKILPNFFCQKQMKKFFALSTLLHLAKLQLFKLDIKMKKKYFLLEQVLESAFTSVQHSTISRIWVFLINFNIVL